MSKNQSDLELRRTILIVDDDAGSRKTLRDILEIKGYTTEVFATGKPAVEWAKQGKAAIALIDLKLEDMSGLEVLQQLKQVSPDVECILVTGYASKASAIDAINLGAYSYVQKPYDMERLLLTIRRAMEKREAQEEFKRLKELNENIVQSANEGIVVQNSEGYITFANPATCELLGYEQSELAGLHWTVMVPRDQQHLVEAADRRREKMESDQYELELVRKDGERVHVLVSGAPRVDEGAFQGTLAVFTDISARVWAEREIRQRKDELELINTLNEAANRGGSLQEIIDLLTQETKRLLSGSSSTVYLLSKDREHLVMRNFSVPPKIAKRIEKLIGFSIPQIRLPIEASGPYHQILQNGKPRLFNQPEEIRELTAAFTATLGSGGLAKPIEKLIPQIIKLLGTQSVICLPLISGGDPIGMLEISSSEAFAASDLKRMEAIAGQLTAAIERKRSDIRLRESEERFRAIFENAPIGMAIGEAGNSSMKVNRAFEDMLGFSEAERQNLSVEQLTHPEDLEEDIRLYEKVLEGERDHYRLEKRYIRKDNSVMWGDLTLGVVRNGKGGIQYSFAMVADITERKHAEQALHRKLEETTVLHALATVGAEATNVDDLIQWAVDLIGETLYTDNLGVYLLDEESSEMLVHPSYRAGVRTGRYNRIPLGSGIIGQVGLDGQPRRIADVSKEPSYLRADPRVRSELCVPLRMGERIFGVINVESTQLDAFSEGDERLLTTLAGQLATTIEKTRLFGAAQRQAQELSALYDTALATGGVLDTERLLERLSQQVKELLAPDSFLVTLHHPKEAEIEVLLALEMGEKLHDWMGQRLSLAEAGLTGWTIREQSPLLVRDMKRDTLPVQPKHATRPARSWLGVPLVVRDQVVGSMAVQSFQPEVFDEGHRRFLESLAAPVAISLANARLFEETQRHAKEFMQLYETAKDLSGEQDLTKLLETIVERATGLLDVPYGGVYLYDAVLDELELIVAQSFPVPLGTRLKSGEGMAGRVAQTCKPMILEDYRTWEGRSQQYGRDPFTSVLEVPMLYRGELIGVLFINEIAPTIRKFTEAEVQLLSLLGAQAAGAVHSARLFDETHQRAKELEAVATVSAAMRKAPTRAQMTPIIVEQMMDLLETQHAGLAVRDSETGGILIEQGYGVWANLAGQRQEAEEGVGGQVIATGRPFITNDIKESPLMTPPKELGDIRTIACMPLSAGRYTIGALWIGRRTSISEQEVRLLTSIADIAANALNRATLHEELEQRAEELRQRNEELARLYRASGALLSSPTTDIQSLGQTIVETVRQEFGQSSCSLLLVRPDSFEMERVAVIGPCGDQGSEGLLSENGSSIVQKAISRGEIVNVPDFSNNGDYTPCWDQALSGIAIPLKIGDRVTGVINVQSKHSEAFSADDERLMSIFAEKASLALENARLYDQTRRRLERIIALHEIDLAITASVDLRVTLNVLLEQIQSQLEVDAVAVLLYEPSGQMLEYAAERGFSSSILVGTRFRSDEGMAGRAVLERRIVHVPDLNQENDQLPLASVLVGGHFTGYYAVPLIAKGNVQGVLELFHRGEFSHDNEWMDFLETLATQTAIAIDNVEMFDSMNRMNAELRLAYDNTLEGWSRALEMRDHETEGHAQRVTEMTLQLAHKMGMSEDELVHVRRGALLHDIGKMGIPDSILLKPGPLTDEEWELMKQHPTYAYNLLYPIEFLRPALDIPYCHHEKWDGSGYPLGLDGEQIPLAARIFAVVDVWDALSSERPYRDAWPQERVITHIREQSGEHFDPQVVEAFMQVIQEGESVKKQDMPNNLSAA